MYIFSYIPFLIPLIIIVISIIYSYNLINKNIYNFIVFLTSIFYCLFLFKIYDSKYIIYNSSFKILNSSIYMKENFLGTIFVLIISILYPITLLFSIDYFKIEDKKIWKFYILSSISALCGICIAYSQNLITSFIFYEILTLCGFGIIRYSNTLQSKKASYKYLKFLLISSFLFFLSAIFTTYDMIGDINYYTANFEFSIIPFSSMIINLLFFLFFFGIAKTAIFPMSKWLITAMQAPIPGSALLHSVVVVKSGIFLLLQIVFLILDSSVLKQNIVQIQPNINIFSIICILSMCFSILSAIITDNIKKKLAYSTISYLSQMGLTISLFLKNSIYLTMLQFFNHSVAKISLFFIFGEIMSKYQLTNFSELKNQKININIIHLLCLFFSISTLIGFPMTFGFFIKKEILITLFNYNVLFFIIFSFSNIFSIVYFSHFIIKNFELNFIIRDKLFSLISIILLTVLQLLFIFQYKNIIHLFSDHLI